jgi:hypothetical protein
MTNPWLKKNPFLSMWLSGANAAVGVGRSRVTAEVHRQAASAMDEMTRQAFAFWSGGLAAPPARKRRKSR